MGLVCLTELQILGYCGIVITTTYCEEMSKSDYVISYQTANRLIISSAAALKVWSTDPKRSATSSQGIRGYTHVTANLKVTNYFFLIESDNSCK
jgi:hypothetical protein